MGPGTNDEPQLGHATTGRFGPSVVLFAALAALAVGTRTLHRGAADDVAKAPRDAVPESAVGVWLGHNTGGLVVRLSPLSREAERQAFDAKALASRLGLEPGQPFRLECCAHLPAGLEHKRDLWVEDDEGVALVPVANLLSLASDAAQVVDPVLGLLAVPGTAVGSAVGSATGGTVTVLWGRAPGAGARLVAADAKTGLAHSWFVPLAPSTLASGQLPGSTLRLSNQRLAGAAPFGDPR